MLTKEQVIEKMENAIGAHKNALENIKITDKCVVVVVHTNFGSGESSSVLETIGLSEDGEHTKFIVNTTAENVTPFTIKEAKQACKTKLSHERKDIDFTYRYELVDIVTWHKRSIAEIEDLMKFLCA